MATHHGVESLILWLVNTLALLIQTGRVSLVDIKYSLLYRHG